MVAHCGAHRWRRSPGERCERCEWSKYFLFTTPQIKGDARMRQNPVFAFGLRICGSNLVIPRALIPALAKRQPLRSFAGVFTAHYSILNCLQNTFCLCDLAQLWTCHATGRVGFPVKAFMLWSAKVARG